LIYLWTLRMFLGNVIYFFSFWYFVQRQFWQPWLTPLDCQIILGAMYQNEDKIFQNCHKTCIPNDHKIDQIATK
jgi:hypothetical protein